MQNETSNKKPFYNALKYASSFPVIFLSAAQRDVVSDLVKERGSGLSHDTWHGEHPLFRLWYAALVISFRRRLISSKALVCCSQLPLLFLVGYF